MSSYNYSFAVLIKFMNILLTGGTGYIGSHTAIELIKAGHKVIILDNLSNSSISVLDDIHEITNVKPVFVEGDIADRKIILSIFSNQNINMVIHFAGLKSVNESAKMPIEYYKNNFVGALNLISVMSEMNVKNLIFSSSASVYGPPATLPITENMPTIPVSVYGKSKLYIENMISDVAASDPDWRFVILRYFNPVGAHESGRIGERSIGVPHNLAPYIAEVILEKQEHLKVYGDDYPTPDGTGVRDYIHVVDLALGHASAINYINTQRSGCEIFNLGTGQGTSVFKMIDSFERVIGKRINYKIVDRRVGDVAECFADVTKAKKLLGWEATKSLDDMCKSAFLYSSKILN